MNFIDSHSHLYLKEFSEDLPQVIERARSVGVSHILMPNIDSTTIADLLEVCATYKGYCFPMSGLHPTSVNSSYKEELEVVKERLANSDNYIAVGEIGLDLYWDKTYLEEQLIAFEEQVKLALAYNLPIVVHTRDAFEPLYEVLSPYKHTPLKGVFHSFTGSREEAEKLLEFTGFKLGINGVVTFKNSSLSETLKSVPLTSVIIETDAPYLTPVPYRGKRNESAFLVHTLKKLTEIYTVSIGELAGITTENTFEVFERLK